MLPREKNGVVDSNLRVYGTANIRVADLSIVPIQFCAHSQGKCCMLTRHIWNLPVYSIATAYAIAEIGWFSLHFH